jgi:hypothetical protein
MSKNSFFLITVIAFSTYAMEEGQRIKDPFVYFMNNQAVYIGKEGETREVLEKIYEKEFPLNTVFFPIEFKHTKQLGLRSKYGKNPDIPAFIPYDLIKDKNEGDPLVLELNGTKYTFTCKHKGKGAYQESTFQEIVKNGYERFLAYANWLCESEKSLIHEKVITHDCFSRHGENATPEL